MTLPRLRIHHLMIVVAVVAVWLGMLRTVSTILALFLAAASIPAGYLTRRVTASIDDRDALTRLAAYPPCFLIFWIASATVLALAAGAVWGLLYGLAGR
jgi:hypothetical protein